MWYTNAAQHERAAVSQAMQVVADAGSEAESACQFLVLVKLTIAEQ